MLARQREGIATAKAEGKYKGRKPTVRMQTAEILRLHREGGKNAEIARRLGVHRANVGRVSRVPPPDQELHRPLAAVVRSRRRS